MPCTFSSEGPKTILLFIIESFWVFEGPNTSLLHIAVPHVSKQAAVGLIGNKIIYFLFKIHYIL